MHKNWVFFKFEFGFANNQHSYLESDSVCITKLAVIPSLANNTDAPAPK